MMAEVGHTFIHEGSSHCIHIMGTEIAASSYEITVTLEHLGLKALILLKEHTSSQVLQPIHLSGESINILLTSLLAIRTPDARLHLLFLILYKKVHRIHRIYILYKNDFSFFFNLIFIELSLNLD
jgi:hypothetical protein